MAILIRFVFLLWLAAPALAVTENSFVALSYHEVERDDAAITSPTVVRVSDLAAQFAWLKANGYQPVHVDQILAARAGGPVLPEKAVLLTFDDGLRNFYTHAFPLLKLFNYPAVIALVGRWLDVPEGGTVDYDGTPKSRNDFMTWSQIRELQASGLVEVATHAYDLHQGIPANPQGNTQPAAITRRFAEGVYEPDQVYLDRLRRDLRASQSIIANHTENVPRILVWPYGRSNLAGQEVARELGIQLGFTLEDGPTLANTPLLQTRRYLIEHSPSLKQFAETLRGTWSPDPARSVRIDPGPWGGDESGLSATLDSLLALQPNIAFLVPSIYDHGTEKTLFPTPRRPLARDELNRIAWQIERRSGVPVFIDLPSTWLSDKALISDLARHVNFAGLRLSAMPGSDQAVEVRSAAEHWRWPLRLAFDLPGLPDEGVWTALRAGDLVILSADTDIASLPEASKSSVLFEFTLNDSPAKIARRMRDLEAAGFRQFGLAGFPLDIDRTEIELVLSLRSVPRLP
jgi:poly-beta-1,6-N-acetyl-D-glucosamine N-deacetylase